MTECAALRNIQAKSSHVSPLQQAVTTLMTMSSREKVLSAAARDSHCSE